MKKYLRLDRNYTLVFLILSFLILGSFSYKTDQECNTASPQDNKKTQKSIRVAGVKAVVSNDINANVTAIKNAIDFARQEKADILQTPEGSLSGYTSDFNREDAEKALKEIVAYASSAKVGLALGTCFYEEDNKCYNEIRFYDKEGNFLGFHSKILRTGNHNDPKAGEINEYASKPLRTFEFEGVIIGGLICNDMWANPACTTLPDTQLSQQLSKMGARIIFHAVNGGRGDKKWSVTNWNFHESNLLMRAYSGNIWVVTTDNSDPINLDSSCPSGVIDPGGNWVCETEAKGVRYFAYTISFFSHKPNK